MLEVVLSGDEFFNEETEEFVVSEPVVVRLEHSLASVSKWEAKYQKAFLTEDTKSSEEIYDYLKMMVLDEEISDEVFARLSNENLDEINAYIESPQSATTFGNMPERTTRGERVTSELVYYWMVAFQIPFECQHWHINRLFALIRIANIKNNPNQKKMPRHQIAQRNRELNERRRREMNTKG